MTSSGFGEALEVPEADAVEQEQPVRADEERMYTDVPAEAPDADAIEQHQIVPQDDEDYR
jgi:hypothetical protein